MKQLDDEKLKVRGKIDPRRALFLKYYLDIESKTFSNAYQSAVKAGYDESYAEQILGQNWVSENIRYDIMVRNAEKNLEEFLDMEEDVEVNIRNKEGDILETKTVKDGKILDVKANVSKFVAERLGKFGEKKEIDIKSQSLDEIASALKDLAKNE